MDPLTKTCSKCGVEKPRIEFNKNATIKSGLHSACKSCCAVACKIWYRANVEKRRVYGKEWRTTHAEIKHATDTAWRKANSKRIKVTSKNYRINNPNKVLLYRAINKEKRQIQQKIWHLAHPQTVRVYAHNRRARAMKVQGTHTPADIQILYATQQAQCFYCGSWLLKYHIDHKIPLNRIELHPTNDIANLCLACPSCNLRKHTKTAEEFLKSFKR